MCDERAVGRIVRGTVPARRRCMPPAIIVKVVLIWNCHLCSQSLRGEPAYDRRSHQNFTSTPAPIRRGSSYLRSVPSAPGRTSWTIFSLVKFVAQIANRNFSSYVRQDRNSVEKGNSGSVRGNLVGCRI